MTDTAEYLDHAYVNDGVLSPDVYMLRMRNIEMNLDVKMYRYGQRITKDFMILEDPRDKLNTPWAYDGDESVFFGGNANFGHWCFEWLPRLATIFELGYDWHTLNVWEHVPAKYLEFLDLLDLNYTRVRPGVTYKNSVLIPSSPVGRYQGKPYVWKPAVQWLVKAFDHTGKHITSKPHDKVYVPREGTHRLIDNEEEVQKALEAAGFACVQLDKACIETQIWAMRNAKEVVMPSGAGSPITMFCPGKVIELAPPSIDGIFGAKIWALAKGTPYTRINGTITKLGETSNPQRDASYKVDIEELKRVVNEAVHCLSS